MKQQFIKSNQEIISKKVFYSLAVFGDEEKKAVMKSMENGWLASGPTVVKFEEEIAKLFGKKYGIAVNSGSSANLLAIASLKLPKGSEVITPACTFSTTVSGIVLKNLVPVFVDSVIGRYTIDESLVEKAITKKTKAIMVPQLVGGVCNMKLLKQIADKHNLILIDDSCDTLAPTDGTDPVSKYSKVTTTSFYGSHIITAMGFGGMILTDDIEIRDRLINMRDWGRVGNDRESFDDRFNFEIDGIPYDSKFIYAEFGYNCKINEAAAAFGLEQVKKLPKFLKIRNQNFEMLLNYFSKHDEDFYLPELLTNYTTNWLAFPLTIKDNAPFKRYDLLKHLEEKGIQTRVLFSGNIVRHPITKEFEHKVVGSLENADKVMASGFLLGCHHGMGKSEVNYIIKCMDEFYSKII